MIFLWHYKVETLNQIGIILIVQGYDSGLNLLSNVAERFVASVCEL